MGTTITLANFEDNDPHTDPFSKRYISRFQPTKTQLRKMKKDDLVEYTFKTLAYMDQQARNKEARLRESRKRFQEEREQILTAWSRCHPRDLQYMIEQDADFFRQIMYRWVRPTEENRTARLKETAECPGHFVRNPETFDHDKACLAMEWKDHE